MSLFTFRLNLTRLGEVILKYSCIHRFWSQIAKNTYHLSLNLEL
jgi:hypothetical protein